VAVTAGTHGPGAVTRVRHRRQRMRGRGEGGQRRIRAEQATRMARGDTAWARAYGVWATGKRERKRAAVTIGSIRHDAVAPVHVELAPRRREAVAESGRRTGGVERGREQGPGHGGGVEGVQVVEKACGRGVLLSGWRIDGAWGEGGRRAIPPCLRLLYTSPCALPLP
jgi:hypothetical protein